MQTADKLQQFLHVFEVPDFIVPWIDRFFKEIEIDLVNHLAKQALTREKINQSFISTNLPDSPEFDLDLTTRSYRKGIITLREDGRFEPADFHARFDKWAMFEGWKDIPDDVCNQLNAWEFAHYEKRHSDQITKLKKGQPRDRSLIYPEYLLLHEAEDLLDLVEHVYLMPCNCRSMENKCSQSLYTCLRFENDRDVGWEISKYRAKKIVHQANSKGLMQSGEVEITADGSIKGAICNCCIDCCYPQKLAEHHHVPNLWPLSRYVAHHLVNHCIVCGRCVKRCPFQAFKLVKSRTSKAQSIQFSKALCRGCGVCCSGCPEEAIEMRAVECNHSILNKILNVK